MFGCCCNECSCEDNGVPPFIAGQDNTAIPYRARASHEYGLTGGIYPWLHKKASQSVSFFTPTLSPTPMQRAGYGGSGGTCDCTADAFLTYSGTPPAGANWTSFNLDPQPESWQGSAQNLLATSPPFQTFANSGTDALGVCHNYGHKEVMGQAQWYGMYSFTSNDSCPTPSLGTGADGTRYRTLTATFNYSQTQSITASITNPSTFPAETGTVAIYGEVAITVDTHSGEITVNAITPFNSSGTTFGGFTGPNGQWVPRSPTQLNFGIQTCIEGLTPPMGGGDYRLFLSGIINGLAAAIRCGGYNTGGGTQDMEWLVQNFENPYSPTLSGGSTPTNASMTNTYSAASGYNYMGSPYTNTASGSASASIGATNFQYSASCTGTAVVNVSGSNVDQLGTSSASFSLVLALSDANTASAVRSDIETNLLSKYNMADHAQLPWRHDQFPGIMPKVTRRQVPVNVSPLQDIINASSGLFSNSQPLQCSAADDGSGNLIITTANPLLVKAGTTIVLYSVAPVLAVWVTKTISTVTDSTHFAVNGIAVADLIASIQSFGIVGSLQYDGTIYGGPNPNGAGGVGWFDFYFTDWRYCQVASGCSGTPFLPYQYCQGGNLSDAQLSLSNASLWNDLRAFSHFLPPCATHWTSNYEAHNIPFGAMIDIGGNMRARNGTGIDSPITIVKWAKARLPVPSANFARPCGLDRTLIDEPTAQYLTNADVQNVSCTLVAAFVPSLTNQVIMIFGSQYNDGFWTGCTMTGTVLNLGAKLANIPTGFTRPFVTELWAASTWRGIAGIVRFPIYDSSRPTISPAWPINGRQAITFASDGISGSIISFASAQVCLWSVDKLDLNNSSMSVVQANQPTKRFEPFQTAHTYTAGDCVFDGTNGQLCTTGGTTVSTPSWSTSLLGTTTAGTAVFTLIKFAPNVDMDFHCATASGSLTGSVWATNPLTPAAGPSAPEWYWYDAAQKFDTRYGSWTTANRPTSNVVTFGGCYADILPMSPCFPMVTCFSPNSESWPTMTVPDGMGGTTTAATGHNLWFGSGGLQDFTADGIYGSRVQAIVEYEATDPLWQAPACPPNITSGFTIYFSFVCHEDFGTCHADDPITIYSTANLYYPPHPMVEALCALPTSANGAGSSRNEAAPALPTDAVNGALTWPSMVQPTAPGIPNTSYNALTDYCVLYTNELATITSNPSCRWLQNYYAHTLGGDK